jgi:hypothetical protein
LAKGDSKNPQLEQRVRANQQLDKVFIYAEVSIMSILSPEVEALVARDAPYLLDLVKPEVVKLGEKYKEKLDYRVAQAQEFMGLGESGGYDPRDLLAGPKSALGGLTWLGAPANAGWDLVQEGLETFAPADVSRAATDALSLINPGSSLAKATILFPFMPGFQKRFTAAHAKHFDEALKRASTPTLDDIKQKTYYASMLGKQQAVPFDYAIQDAMLQNPPPNITKDFYMNPHTFGVRATVPSGLEGFNDPVTRSPAVTETLLEFHDRLKKFTSSPLDTTTTLWDLFPPRLREAYKLFDEAPEYKNMEVKLANLEPGTHSQILTSDLGKGPIYLNRNDYIVDPRSGYFLKPDDSAWTLSPSAADPLGVDLAFLQTIEHELVHGGQLRVGEIPTKGGSTLLDFQKSGRGVDFIPTLRQMPRGRRGLQTFANTLDAASGGNLTDKEFNKVFAVAMDLEMPRVYDSAVQRTKNFMDLREMQRDVLEARYNTTLVDSALHKINPKKYPLKTNNSGFVPMRFEELSEKELLDERAKLQKTQVEKKKNMRDYVFKHKKELQAPKSDLYWPLGVKNQSDFYNKHFAELEARAAEELLFEPMLKDPVFNETLRKMILLLPGADATNNVLPRGIVNTFGF